MANARTMASAWHRVVGGPCAACNAGSSAFDGRSIDVVGTPGSTLFALARAGGATNWSDPLADGVHYESTSVANGVIYAVDNDGFLDAFTAATGRPLLKHQLSADTDTPTGGGLTSNGVSIARPRFWLLPARRPAMPTPPPRATPASSPGHTWSHIDDGPRLRQIHAAVGR